jgi:ribosome-dependent ATPase
VTIFLSTHFMNEAERCDRMSMMHRGTVLAQGRPADLVAERKAATLEEAFIGYLEDAADKPAEDAAVAAAAPPPEPVEAPASNADDSAGRFSLGRVWAFARREAIELRHDSVRLAFAVLGPIVLMIVFGYGISLDVDKLAFSILDFDNTPASRVYADSFRGSGYYAEKAPLQTYAERDRRLRNGELRFAVEIPSGFQQELQQGRQPTVQADFDAAVPFRAETARTYVESSHDRFDAQVRSQNGLPAAQKPVNVDTRALYNQAFESVFAMVPGDLMLLLMLIPSMLTALSVVREKELGSIANFYAAPATRSEFLLGKQLPYVGVALIQFVTLVLLAIVLFHVPIKGSIPTLALGGLIYVLASTGFGLLISVFAPTQTAAIFAAAIITILPAVQFSGMFVPVSSLTGGAWFAAKIFPSTYFHAISVGTFTKALGMAALWPNIVALTLIATVYFSASAALLKKQEA